MWLGSSVFMILTPGDTDCILIQLFGTPGRIQYQVQGSQHPALFRMCTRAATSGKKGGASASYKYLYTGY